MRCRNSATHPTDDSGGIMHKVKKYAMLTIAAFCLMLATISNPSVAYAGTASIGGVIECNGGLNAVQGVYVANETNSSRSGWANLWWSGSVQRYAYDGANTGDTVRLHVGCNPSWSPTYYSASHYVHHLAGATVVCSNAWGTARCNI